MSDKIVGMLGYDITLDMHTNDFSPIRSNFGFCSRRRRRYSGTGTSKRDAAHADTRTQVGRQPDSVAYEGYAQHRVTHNLKTYKSIIGHIDTLYYRGPKKVGHRRRSKKKRLRRFCRHSIRDVSGALALSTPSAGVKA